MLLVARAGQSAVAQELHRQRNMMCRLGYTQDYREGVADFLEKRPANFVGR